MVEKASQGRSENMSLPAAVPICWYLGMATMMFAMSIHQLHFVNLMFFFKSANSKTQEYLLKKKLYITLKEQPISLSLIEVNYKK